MKPEPIPYGTKQILLPMPDLGDSARNLERLPGRSESWSTCAQFPFLPRGLALWGATPDTYVTGVTVGHQSELMAGYGRIPGRYFEVGKTMTELARLADLGELEGAVEPRQILSMNVAEVGAMVRVSIEGPFSTFCLWGLTYSGAGPAQNVLVERAVFQGPVLGEQKLEDRWSGRIVERGLGGDSTVLEVMAPTPEIAASLLTAAFGKR